VPQGAGYLVDTPEMCWSRRRIYDRPFLDCLTEIDSAIGRLKGHGTGRIVVAGMRQGGDAALAYGARRANLAGIIALAPAAAPERQVGSATSRKTSLRLARWSSLAAETKPPALSIATQAARSP
jgi:pimeloyl-ACP methyl ester carboxylesterase